MARAHEARKRYRHVLMMATYPLCDECGEVPCAVFCMDCGAGSYNNGQKLCEFCSECIHCMPGFDSHRVAPTDWGPREHKAARKLQRSFRGRLGRKAFAAAKRAAYFQDAAE